jgi:hypothetical protein
MTAVLLRGTISTILALSQVYAWVALGCFFTRHSDEETRLPLSLLIGSALTAFLYSVTAACWSTTAAMLAVALLCGLAAVGGGRRAWRGLAVFFGGPLGNLLGGRWKRITLAAGLACFWLIAIAPPRDGDVMRYHLAHIRQIDVDGSWQPIPDHYYAMPFGWSFNYLPFEHLGYPQTAHLLNLCLGVVTAGMILAALGGVAGTPPAFLLFLVLATQPAVLKTYTTAFADAYLAFAMGVVAVLAVKLLDGKGGLAYLGFAAWIGLQSRYQAGAIALASVPLALWIATRQKQWRSLPGYVAGAAAAGLLAAPFYLFNWLHFRNPFFPLLAQWFDKTSYMGLLAAQSAPLQNQLSWRSIVDWASWMFAAVEVFPLPALAAALPLAALCTRNRRTRLAATLSAMFLLLWAIVQPDPLPRFILAVLPLLLLGWAPVLHRICAWPAARPVLTGCLAGAIFVFSLADLVYARDYARYLVTGNARAFHYATYLYEVHDWVNTFTPPQARLLVIVSYGCSYPLRRWHRRAEPDTSAVCDWRAVKSAEDLRDFLRRGAYDYVIYEQRDWSTSPGGPEMTAAIQEAVRKGFLAPTKLFLTPVYQLRMLNQSEPVLVQLLRVQP